ncbi:MAG: SDR family oxidoreductase [Bacteroidota bacterium]|jgi:NAD(P)-dependent dehydrogenase (short-subunit alcohol dehydrogenase family)|nr:SDR family oxidoreductase [Bacteroidota bacterium]
MNHLFSLKEKVIVITGGTGFLGNSFIDGIAEAGGTVGILGRNRKIAEERATKINREGGKAIALCADVTNKNDLVNAKKMLLDSYGKIDGLVNAAGGNMQEGTVESHQDIFNLNMGGLKKVMDLNLWGTILPTQIFGDAIAHHGEGSIVNISSIAANQVVSKVLGYSMAKASVEIFTKWFAIELSRRYGDAIKMNAIVPGFFLTKENRTLFMESNGINTQRGIEILRHTPFKRFGEPHELKGILVWLLSNASKFVTGATINVDGGFNINSCI